MTRTVNSSAQMGLNAEGCDLPQLPQPNITNFMMLPFRRDRSTRSTEFAAPGITRFDRKPWNTAIASVAALSCMALLTHSAQAQSITPAVDGTNTIVTPNGNRLDITGGTRSQDGSNLFQSFQQFGLTTNQIANFLATPQTRNILGRVVGGDASIINGLIQVSGSNANLYLMNPAGIVFGANASLNVSGAFTATTATGLGFGGGEASLQETRWLSAIGANDAATLLGDPTAFAFTVAQPGAIVNAGSLAVSAGQSLSLVGGTVINTGTLTAPGGALTLVAVPGQSLVQLRQPGSLLSFEVNPLTQPLTVTSPQSLSSQSLPNAWTLPIASLPALLTGGNMQNATGITVNPDGTVRLVALPQQNSSQPSIAVEPGTTIVSGTLQASGGTVQVLGDRVAAIGATISASSNAGGGTILLGGGAHGQGTVPNAAETVVDVSSTLTADSLLSGAGGQVVVWSDHATQFAGTIRARGGAQEGNGGFVEISSKGNLAYQGLVDVAAPAGRQGTVLFDPENITIVPGSDPGAADSRLPTIFSGAFPGTSLTISQSALQNTVGDVILEATNNITIQALTNGALNLNPQITSITFRADADRNGVGSFSMAPGDAIITRPGVGSGNLAISGVNLTVGTLTTAAPFTNAGSVTLSASGNITATSINTSSTNPPSGGFAGGAVTITAGGTIDINGITTEGAQRGGNVALVAQDNITTGAIGTNRGSPTLVQGAGGTIDISSTRGSITTSTLITSGSSSGGSVTLQAPSSTGNITFRTIDTRASQTGGVGGAVDITAGRFVRGRGFTTASSASPTIVTSGDSSGAVTIRHGGGSRNTPFVVGNAAINGTAGAISASATGAPNIIAPTRSFPQSATQGNIQILTTTTQTRDPQPDALRLPTDDPTDILTDLPDAPPPLEAPETAAASFNELALDKADLERDASAEFEGYLALPDGNPNPTPLAANVLSEIGDVAGVKPALVYAAFVPPNVATRSLPMGQALASLGRSEPHAKALAATLKPTVEAESVPLWQFDGVIAPRLTKRIDAQRIDRLAQQPSAASASDNDQLELVVVMADGKPIRRLVPGATRGRVLPVVQHFLNEVTDPRKSHTTSYLASAQQLYRWLVAPIEPELKAKGIGNLAYISDTGLRFLPMSALHDGHQFLVEKYSIGLMPSLSLTDTRYVSLKNARVLAMGASTFTDQPPLPAVPTELSVITHDLWSGAVFLNQAFTLEKLKTERQQEPFQIIHLATHGEFQSGALSNSYIQLWDTRLKLDQLRQLGWNKPPVELLVLSACRTSLGSKDAELGFAGFAVQAGVKSVLASLWSVSDEGTLGLMTEFYRQLRTAPIKAEALRQAQIALLKGEVTVVEGQLRSVRGSGIQLPIAPADRADTYSLAHPYYWSAFTLIGSPW